MVFHRKKVFNKFLVFLLAIVIFVLLWNHKKHSSPRKINKFYDTINFNSDNESDNRTLVFYAYFEKNSHHVEALKFFIEFGIKEYDNLDYVFIIQGSKCSVDIPKYKNVMVLPRSNTCFDFGAFKDAIMLIGGEDKINYYKAIIYINSSVFGPFLPKYWPPTLHWSEIFLSRLNDTIQLVGSVLACLPDDDLGGAGPKVSGYFFVTTPYITSNALKYKVFDCFTNKQDAIVKGEYGLSRLVLEMGYNMDSMLAKYGDIDWRNKSYWDCNEKKFPFLNKQYGNNMDTHPFETVFHKPIWTSGDEIIADPYLNETYEYMKWARERKEIELERRRKGF